VPTIDLNRILENVLNKTDDVARGPNAKFHYPTEVQALFGNQLLHVCLRRDSILTKRSMGLIWERNNCRSKMVVKLNTIA